jgi:spore cortex biosynthesis protein YabQ
MEVSLHGQLLEFAAALLMGAGMGFVYDCMRIVRGRVPLRIVTAMLDLLFWLTCAAMAFWFAMTFGSGELREFSLLAMGLGIVAYFLLLSVFVRAVGFAVVDGATELIRVLTLPFVFVAKKIHKVLTKLFPFIQRWHILREERKNGDTERRKHETKEKTLAGQAGDFGVCGVVSPHSGGVAGSNQQTQKRKRRTGKVPNGAGAPERDPAGGYWV